MQRYEFMVVLRPDLDVKDEKQATDVIKNLIGAEAKISDVTLMGKKQLAYLIKKRKEGTYILSHLTGSLKTSDIEKRVRLGSDVLRYLLILKA